MYCCFGADRGRLENFVDGEGLEGWKCCFLEEFDGLEQKCCFPEVFEDLECWKCCFLEEFAISAPASENLLSQGLLRRGHGPVALNFVSTRLESRFWAFRAGGFEFC